MIDVKVSILKNLDYTKKLNFVFNLILLLAASLALPQLAEPTKALTTKFLKLENIEILFMFIGVLFIVNIYRQLGNIADYLMYWTRFLKSPRLSLIFTSMILGLMPVKGRTLISSPVIGQITEKHKLNKMSAAMVDYLATHIVYLLLPIEGMVIVALSTFAVLGFNLLTLISYTLPGIIFFMLLVTYYSWKTGNRQSIELPRSQVKFSQAAKVTLPIVLLLIAAYLYAQQGVTYALITGTIVFVGLSLLFLSPTKQQIKGALKTMDKQLIVTLMLIFLFSATVSQLPFIQAWAAAVIASSFAIPALIVICYLIGFFLGSSKGTATAIFPLLLPLISNAPNAFQIIAIAYAAGWAGYIASPAHACCHYAASYFDTPYLKVWSRISIYSLIASALIIVTALIRG
ncbi:MAG: hypothetical protein A3A24_00140 [Candidatus Buchananbacteria bacterium RIFCSPLOWO2_01_FULL_46_12]|uniref:DUF401 family protein n=1 Tax=Candidatus Buchananbacteria bacterium RIFCSPLOWO2_01_FULL_46_12 TaxID=1797546 RepID=A0A1G1YN71_9BACT|nr:MAG: hypothetical protein A3A24_00140 [Candidatus Buchananbacteria bacterium RIFCSPLOWO2_01_FULL_46_12]